MINIENLISALIGSIIGILISGTYGRLNTAIKINSYRKLILTYSKFVVIKNVNNYIEDSRQAKLYISNYLDIHNNGLKMKSKYNLMPMFNSEIFKNIPNEYLFKIFPNKEMYADFLDTIYSIDFLKNNMPSIKIQNFTDDLKKHIEYQKIEPKCVHDHLEVCSTLKGLIKNFQTDTDFKITRAEGILSEVQIVEDNLKGYNLFWTFKYFFIQ